MPREIRPYPVIRRAWSCDWIPSSLCLSASVIEHRQITKLDDVAIRLSGGVGTTKRHENRADGIPPQNDVAVAPGLDHLLQKHPVERTVTANLAEGSVHDLFGLKAEDHSGLAIAENDPPFAVEHDQPVRNRVKGLCDTNADLGLGWLDHALSHP
nr:hypothetical protein [Salinihabitans flavidus]